MCLASTAVTGPAPAALTLKAGPAAALLRCCTLCEWRCEVDRTAGARGPCGLAAQSHVFREYLSVTEELEVIPALRVYLAGCNFLCAFCDTAPDCFAAPTGPAIEPSAFAARLHQAVRRGARAISILGGEPTLHAPTLVAIAAAAPAPLPLVINTNLYMTPETLELLQVAVTTYLADFKFGNDHCAQRLAGVPRYSEVVHRNLQWIANRTRLFVRHLLMPGHFDCCFRPVVDWLSDALPGCRFQLYTGFVPCWHADGASLGRLNTRAETRVALEYLHNSRLDWKAGADGRA